MSSAMQSRLNAVHMNMLDMDDIMNKHSQAMKRILNGLNLKMHCNDKMKW